MPMNGRQGSAIVSTISSKFQNSRDKARLVSNGIAVYSKKI